MADFGSVVSLGLDLNVPIGGRTYNLNGSGTTTGSGSSFSISGTATFFENAAANNVASLKAFIFSGPPTTPLSFSTSGFLVGANASHAGLVYQFDSDLPMGNVSGAAAFKRGAPATSMLTGTQTYSTAFSTNGLTHDSDTGTGTINSSGELTSFTFCGGECVADANVASGNKIEKLGNDGLVAWGKWIQSGDSFGALGSGEGVLHYVTGIPTTDSQISLGSTGTYTLLGGSVTGSDSGAGSISSASMTVDFSVAQMTSLAVEMKVDGNDYSLTDTSKPSIAGFGSAPVFSSDGASVTGGGGCSSGCNAYINGAFFGAGAARAGVAFKFSDTQTHQNIAGAVALKK